MNDEDKPQNSNDDKQLQQQIDKQSKRLQKADRERRSILSESVFVGTLGLVFVLPVVVGAYLGRWLDSKIEGYSMRWTLSLLIVGIVLGGYSVYRNIKD